MKCSKCGAEIPAGSQFCGHCGNKVEPEVDRSGSTAFAYLCPICKTPNPKTVNYCVKCGHWLLDSNFEAIPLSEQQYYQYINSRGRQNPRAASVTAPKKKVNVVIPIIVYALYLLILISVPLVAKVFFALLIIPYGIVNICIPLRRMLIPKRFIGILITVFGLVLSICLLANYSPTISTSGTTGINSTSSVSSSSKVSSTAASKAASSKSNTVSKSSNSWDSKFTVSDLQLKDQGYGIFKITGSIVNKTDKQYGYLQVEINEYDDSGAQVGSTLANVNNLEPKSTWKFEAYATSDNVKTVKVKDVTGF